ncbi:hypothetical protein BO78DRAFT_274677, partial [Aspergillus sclerotiicarbonarius CBS 121057]
TPLAKAKKAVHNLLTAFTQSLPLPTLLSTFTTTPAPLIHEHGLPTLAPFLGRDFVGQDGVQEYFTLVGELLGFEGMRFEDEGGWVVGDFGGGDRVVVVVVRGWARFFAKRTGEAWWEGFVYRLGVCRDRGEGIGGEGDGEWKVQEYRVWADTGAAYLALRGELSGLDGLGR